MYAELCGPGKRFGRVTHPEPAKRPTSSGYSPGQRFLNGGCAFFEPLPLAIFLATAALRQAEMQQLYEPDTESSATQNHTVMMPCSMNSMA